MERRQLFIIVGVILGVALAGGLLYVFVLRGDDEADTAPVTQVAQGAAPAAPGGVPTGQPPAGAPAQPGATPPAAGSSVPTRADPFLPFDWVPPAVLRPVPPTVLDYGFPGVVAGPEPERAASEQPRVAAIAWDYQGKVFATIELDGQTYVVEPGEYVGGVTRVVSIDRTTNTVTLQRDTEKMELTLMPRAAPVPGR